MLTLSILLGALSVLLYSLCRHLRKNRGVLEALGIPVVKPSNPFLGSPPYDFHNVLYWKLYLERHKRYGLTYGYYEGISPVINTMDPEIVKSVAVKNSECFADKMDLEASIFSTYRPLDVNSN